MGNGVIVAQHVEIVAYDLHCRCEQHDQTSIALDTQRLKDRLFNSQCASEQMLACTRKCPGLATMTATQPLVPCLPQQVHLPEGVSVSCGSLMNSNSSFRPLSYLIWKRRGRTSSGASARKRQFAVGLCAVNSVFWANNVADLGSLLQCPGLHSLQVSSRLMSLACTRLAQSTLAQKRSRTSANCSARKRP